MLVGIHNLLSIGTENKTKDWNHNRIFILENSNLYHQEQIIMRRSLIFSIKNSSSEYSYCYLLSTVQIPNKYFSTSSAILEIL